MSAATTTVPPAMASLAHHIDAACARVAPTWPLDEFIAVNPCWGWIGGAMQAADAELGALAGTRLLMPREWFQTHWEAGLLRREHLRAALAQEPSPVTIERLVADLYRPSAPAVRLPLVSDLRDAVGPALPGQTWQQVVTHQISQHCAAWFDRDQASWRPADGDDLFASWRIRVAADLGLPWQRGHRWVQHELVRLPQAPVAAIGALLERLGMPAAAHTPYLTAVLLSMQGWAAWCAYERWQARLRGSDDDCIVQLLAIRLTWEWLLRADAGTDAAPPQWTARWSACTAAIAATGEERRTDWLLQSALEIAYRQQLVTGLRAAPSSAGNKAPRVQAAFCIDVRSEVFRRALETVADDVHTRGFAGFFGLPIAYSPAGSSLHRPQLPGLLAPALTVGETTPTATQQQLADQRHAALQHQQRWAEWKRTPGSIFGFVEATGLLQGMSLLGDGLPSVRTPRRWETTGLGSRNAAALRPQLPAMPPASAAAIAHKVLTAMGLVRDFAPLVLLCGHGSQSANNPHAAGLDCGACGGQTGEVNARALADLLNQPVVREELRRLGIDAPASTHFLPALHNTTTDDVVLFDTDAVPAALHGALQQLRTDLAAAGQRARAERAPSLGLGHLAAAAAPLARAIRQRANDWAQLRPEWGLAGNAAFLVAPRARSRHLDLGGRVFLHDYDWQLDRDLSTLTLILTAPMVVTHWINMQYNASTVDNGRYGSGNKVLHNVVGGRIGVFEGNGGDLRIGLPIQSLHDGRTLRHTPLRLQVFVEAPRAGIESVVAAHQVVRDLVDNGWLHLLRIEPDGPTVERWRAGSWFPA